MSYGIIERHRGRIEVQSELNRGTTIAIHLPLEAAEEGPSVCKPLSVSANFQLKTKEEDRTNEILALDPKPETRNPKPETFF